MTQNRANSFSAYAEFTLSDLTKAEILKYQLLDFDLPAYNVNPIEIRNGDRIYSIPGNELSKSNTVEMEFILDEELKVYTEIISLMEQWSGNGFSNDLLTVLVTDNKSNFIMRTEYKHVWISSLSGIQYSTKEGDTTMYVTVTLNFADVVHKRI